MQKKALFRRQQICIAFAFLGTATLAGCASDGSLKPSTESQLISACDKAQGAVTVAGFFQEKMTPAELTAYHVAIDAVDGACSPAALASYGTPAAQTTAIGILGKVIRDMDAVKDAAPVASVGNRT